MDFRALNEATVGSCHPLPFQNDIIEHLAKAQHVTAVYLATGYFQISNDPKSTDYTTFYGTFGTGYRYKRMAMDPRRSHWNIQRNDEFSVSGLARQRPRSFP